MKADTSKLYGHVEFLVNVTPSRNFRNLDSLGKVCEYIKSGFTEIGGSPFEQKWIADGEEYKNIIVSYNPEKSERLVVGAHYDVCGDQPGADDNASAVAGLLETARMVFERKPDLDYRIDFVAFCLEEPPFFGTALMGSHIHAKSLSDEGAKVIGMICYEMIGYFSDEPNSQPYPTQELEDLYPSTANFIVVVGIEKYHQFNMQVHASMSNDSGIDVQVISFPDSNTLAGLSDQKNYWKFGYQALMINNTSFLRNPNYHEKSDTIETLDFEKMTEVINSSYKAITNIV
ncbi:M28 family peptidase [Crocinitomix catalasitica]|nr:M28 family peptidase [Crocinitomix catalasitica]